MREDAEDSEPRRAGPRHEGSPDGVVEASDLGDGNRFGGLVLPGEVNWEVRDLRADGALVGGRKGRALPCREDFGVPRTLSEHFVADGGPLSSRL